MSEDFGDLLCHEGGSLEGMPGPAFRMSDVDQAAVPILIASPHAGRAYTQAVLSAMRYPEASTLKLEDRHVDLMAKAAALKTGTALLVAEAPRAIIDLNRAPDDVDWGMVTGVHSSKKPDRSANRRARSGLGLVPRRLPNIGEIWSNPISQGELEGRLANVHRPYHETLSRMLESLRDRFGMALLLDLHSMPPLQRASANERPINFVVGDRFGTSSHANISSVALDFFEKNGLSVVRNRPYAGGYVLDRHAHVRRSIFGLQLEICRTTYLDESLANPTDGMNAISELIAGLVRALTDEMMLLQDFGDRQAAE